MHHFTETEYRIQAKCMQLAAALKALSEIDANEIYSF